MFEVHDQSCNIHCARGSIRASDNLFKNVVIAA